MKIEIEITLIKPFVKNQKLITTEFKKDMVEVLEKHFKHEWKSISYYERGVKS